MVNRLAKMFLALAFVAGMSACGNDSTEPIQINDEELSDFAVGVEGDQAGLPGLMLSGHRTPGTTGCTFNETTGRIECPPVVRNGLTFAKSFQLLDAAGTPLAQRGDNVVTVNTQIDVEGTVSILDRGEFVVDRSSDLTVTGFGPASANLTYNGEEEGTITGTRTSATRGVITTTESFTHTTDDVVIPKVGDDRPWRRFPLSGTSTRSVEVERTVGGETHEFSFSEVITFNGTAIVPVVVTRNGETKNCTRNLVTHRLHCS